jgi:Tol biopolymer transport system component
MERSCSERSTQARARAGISAPAVGLRIRALAVGLLTLGLPLSATAAQQPRMYDRLPTWSRNGDLAYAHAQRGAEWVMVRDGSGATRRLVENPEPFCCMEALKYSPDGRTLAMTANVTLYLVDVASAKVRSAGPADEFDWAPHSRSLVVKPFYEPLKQLRIVSRADGRIVRRLARGGSPRWSPNGRMIAYGAPSRPDELSDVYVISAGGGKSRRLARVGVPSAWSPDSRQVLFSRFIGGPPGSWLVAARGGAPRRIGQGGRSAWSPTGRHVALWDTDDRIEIVTTAGRLVRRIGGFGPVWSPDGRAIAYWSVRPCDYMGIWRADLSSRKPVRLTGDC